MTDTEKPQKKLPSLSHAVVCLLGLFLWIAFGLFILDAGLHGVLMLGLVWVASNALVLAPSYHQIREAMRLGASRAMPAMFIFLLIGIVIVTFIQAGTIGTLIYYGLEFMHPGIVLPAGLILCSLMSMAVGTSWGTVATGGIVLLGVGGAMGIPLPIIAGMVISGASFGDKMSPVSDTTNLSALSAETDLYQHIRSMAYTTGPTYLIVLVIFSWIGWGYTDQALPQERLDMLLNGLEQAFTINVLMLLPLVVLFVLAMKRVPAEAAMMISSLTAGLMAILFQERTLEQVVTGFYTGATVSTQVDTLDTLLNRGGIGDMTWTYTLAVIAISLGAILEKFGFLRVLLEFLLQRIKRRGTLVASTIMTAFASNLAIAESYISIILTGQLYKKSFDDQGLDRSVLSRSLEEGSTLLTALIPWTTTGVFYASTLGVPTLEYIQWSFLNWINPLMGILFACLGIGMFRRKSGTERTGTE
jgi:NhaC family Na+:H+ antiporter